MISEVDIRDWPKPERREATNHAGWEVQYLPLAGGWCSYGFPYKTKEEALKFLTAIKAYWPKSEWRVYEVLKPKQPAILMKGS